MAYVAFPDEIWIQISSFLQRSDALEMGKCNHRMLAVVRSTPIIWKKLLLEVDGRHSVGHLYNLIDQVGIFVHELQVRVSQDHQLKVPLWLPNLKSIKFCGPGEFIVLDDWVVLYDRSDVNGGRCISLKHVDVADIQKVNMKQLVHDLAVLSLQSLNISFKLISSADFSMLMRHSLVSLNLSGIKTLNASDFALLRELPLQCLLLSSCNIHDEVIQAILPVLPRLHQLNISRNHWISSQGIQALLHALSGDLKSLDLSWLQFPRDILQRSLPKWAGSLQILHVESCESIDDECLITIASHLKALVRLNASKCSAITDRGVAAFLTNTDDFLQELQNRLKGQESDGHITSFTSICPNLKVLELNVCHQLTEATLKNLKSHFEIAEAVHSTCENDQHMSELSRYASFVPHFTRISLLDVPFHPIAMRYIHDFVKQNCPSLAVRHQAPHGLQIINKSLLSPNKLTTPHSVTKKRPFPTTSQPQQDSGCLVM